MSHHSNHRYDAALCNDEGSGVLEREALGYPPGPENRPKFGTNALTPSSPTKDATDPQRRGASQKLGDDQERGPTPIKEQTSLPQRNKNTHTTCLTTPEPMGQKLPRGKTDTEAQKRKRIPKPTEKLRPLYTENNS
ncbi:hypothetical protein CRENBAI_016079 [Crenichthys baileyi]|uniref:Uncharacterized protein n=1 Tax=Crenichthys baileyi TaxID=28760 RepID=A0AAV9RK10_9TELE